MSFSFSSYILCPEQTGKSAPLVQWDGDLPIPSEQERELPVTCFKVPDPAGMAWIWQYRLSE